ncbi:hypothetical protein HDU99_006966, partial [Rhizoclosmatium hyalinum]
LWYIFAFLLSAPLLVCLFLVSDAELSVQEQETLKASTKLAAVLQELEELRTAHLAFVSSHEAATEVLLQNHHAEMEALQDRHYAAMQAEIRNHNASVSASGVTILDLYEALEAKDVELVSLDNDYFYANYFASSEWHTPAAVAERAAIVRADVLAERVVRKAEEKAAKKLKEFDEYLDLRSTLSPAELLARDILWNTTVLETRSPADMYRWTNGWYHGAAEF